MKCPNCDHHETSVKNSRPFAEGIGVMRRRTCMRCSFRWTTHELMVAVGGSDAEPAMPRLFYYTDRRGHFRRMTSEVFGEKLAPAIAQTVMDHINGPQDDSQEMDDGT